ncbi:sperm microtubule inner protein 8-like [Littorina saxatilis]|uniref:TEPP protein n=1 Tax=Littorina saxatilis TaxID=31220 RepID=A0AAN9BXZ8_9CAEN
MTTIGVHSKVVDRVAAMQMPSYSYHYPHLKRVQLAAVKKGIFHPNPPTFRRMDMDTARHLLPDEHSRTTTTCGPLNFSKASSTVFAPPPQKLSSMNVTEQGRAHHRLYTTPQELKKTRAEFSAFLDKCPERFNIELPEIPDKRDLHFTGYAVRYLRPDVTRSWRYTLQQEPNLDQYAQKPIPANVYARYRDSYPQYFRNVASEAWR